MFLPLSRTSIVILPPIFQLCNFTFEILKWSYRLPLVIETVNLIWILGFLKKKTNRKWLVKRRSTLALFSFTIFPSSCPRTKIPSTNGSCAPRWTLTLGGVHRLGDARASSSSEQLAPGVYRKLLPTASVRLLLMRVKGQWAWLSQWRRGWMTMMSMPSSSGGWTRPGEPSVA
jgi:hypothetical protein